MMSAKMTTLGLLKITEFRNKGYDIIIPINDIINKFLSRDSRERGGREAFCSLPPTLISVKVDDGIIYLEETNL